MLKNTIRDPRRLEALKNLRVLDTPITENPFAQIVETVASLVDVPNAAIHLLDDESQWVKALVGEKFACSIEDSFCQHALDREASVWVIPDTRTHSLFKDHPLVIEGRIGFYAAATLETSDGHRVGTLCLTDPEPRPGLTQSQRHLLRKFARIIIDTMELRKDFHDVRSALATVTESDGITGLPNTSSFLARAMRMRDGADEEALIGLVRVQLVEIGTIKQVSGETGLNHVRHDLARRLDSNLGEEEMLVVATDGDFLFARHFQNAGDEAGAQRVREWASRRCRDVDGALSEPVRVKGNNFYVSARFGLATFVAARFEPASAMDATKIAAEKAEKAGTDHGVWYSPKLSKDARFLATAEDGLRKAVEARRFKLAFQPVMALGDGEPAVCGAEALLRWPGQREPVLGPDVFIPMAEQKGLIDEIGLWVFEEACATLARWGERWPLWVSVNVSPLQLNDASLPEKFAEIAAVAGILSSQIKLEITESALAGNFEHIRDMLFRFREIGFLLALDDFGTGHSSLGRVIQLPFDVIKVDRAFVSDTPDGPGAAVVASLAQMTSELGMKAIAEGVETRQQENFLLAKGYHFAQGYRYGRPMFADEFEAWMESRQTQPSAWKTIASG